MAIVTFRVLTRKAVGFHFSSILQAVLAMTILFNINAGDLPMTKRCYFNVVSSSGSLGEDTSSHYYAFAIKNVLHSALWDCCRACALRISTCRFLRYANNTCYYFDGATAPQGSGLLLSAQCDTSYQSAPTISAATGLSSAELWASSTAAIMVPTKLASSFITTPLPTSVDQENFLPTGSSETTAALLRDLPAVTEFNHSNGDTNVPSTSSTAITTLTTAANLTSVMVNSPRASSEGFSVSIISFWSIGINVHVELPSASSAKEVLYQVKLPFELINVTPYSCQLLLNSSLTDYRSGYFAVRRSEEWQLILTSLEFVAYFNCSSCSQPATNDIIVTGIYY